MVWRAFSSTTLSVGIAFEIIIGFLHCACSVQYHRSSAIGTESDSWKYVRLFHLLRRALFLLAKSLHNIPLFFCYQCRVRIFYNNTFMIGANNRLFIFIGYQSISFECRRKGCGLLPLDVRWRIATRSACHSKAVKWVAEEFLAAPLCRDARDGKNGNFTGTVSCVLYGTSVTFFGGRKVPCLDIPLSVAPSTCEKDVVFFQCVPPFIHQLFECFGWNIFPRKRIELFGKFGIPAVERLQLFHHFNEQGYFFGKGERGFFQAVAFEFPIAVFFFELNFNFSVLNISSRTE